MKTCDECKYFRKLEIKRDNTIGSCIRNGEDFPFSIYSGIGQNVSCSSFAIHTFIFIKKTILQGVIKKCNYWIVGQKYKQIADKIEALQPNISNTAVGCISFDVPNKNRMRLKTARFLTRKLGLNNSFLSDKEITNITEKLNYTLFPDVKVKILKGKDITQAYRDRVGGGSCMSGNCADFTKLYEMNPDKIQMLSMYFNNGSARAILYLLDDGKHFLDRIYYDLNMLRAKMKEYADERKWYRCSTIEYLDSSTKNNMSVSDLVFREGNVPYMDTFGGTIINGKLKLSLGNYKFDMDITNGYLENVHYCESCGENVHDDDTVYIGDYSYCEFCAEENFTYVKCCSEHIANSDIIHIKDIEIYVCQYHANTNYTKCEDCGNYYQNDYIVIEDTRRVCNGCSEDSNKYVVCSDCDDWFFNENMEENEDGEVCCQGCYVPSEVEVEVKAEEN